MHRILVSGLTVMLLALPPAVTSAGWNPFADDTPVADDGRQTEISRTVARFRAADKDMATYFDKAYGYAVFPTVGKGGMGIGGAWGKGKVFERGDFIGRSSLTQLTFGFQLGGQAYSEIIFFKDRQALKEFTAGKFELDAQVSAVAATAGVSADADYSNGVAIFTLAKGGLMYEAAVGGQKFNFYPK